MITVSKEVELIAEYSKLKSTGSISKESGVKSRFSLE